MNSYSSNCQSWGISKMQSGREDTLEEQYAVKLCFKLGKYATETYEMLQTAFRPSCMNQASVFEWHKRFKEGRSLWGMMRGVGGVRKSIHQSWLAKGLGLGLLWRRDSVGRGQHSSNRVSTISTRTMHQFTDYLTTMGIKTVPHPPYNPDLALCDFCSFPKLKGSRYETIEKIKEAVTKVTDTLTQEDFHGVFQKLLERYKSIAAGGDYFEWDCVLSIKVPIRKKSGNLFNDPRIL